MTPLHDLPPWASKEASQLLLKLSAQGEGQETEFKQMLPEQGHAIGRSLAAFATSNTGYLIYGVADDGKLVGLPGADSSTGRDLITQRIAGAAKQVRPPVHIELKWAVHQGLVACLVKIEKGFEAIYYAQERPMVRRLSVTRPAEPGEVEHIFRQRYASRGTASQLPSTKQIASRMKKLLALMNVKRYEPITVADMARAMDLSSPADLDGVMEGSMPATFAMLDQFCDRFAVNKEWVTTGREAPFRPTLEHQSLPDDYFDLIEQERPEAVYVVRSRSAVGEAFLALECCSLRYQLIPGVWHVSSHVGGGGSRQLLSLYTLFKRWSTSVKPYRIVGRCIEHTLAESIWNGDAWPGHLSKLPPSNWWDDLTDIEHKWTSRNGAGTAYGPEFVLAQDIVRAQLSTQTD